MGRRLPSTWTCGIGQPYTSWSHSGPRPALWTGSGQDQREAYRLLHLHTIAPLADAIAAELSKMFNERVALDLERNQSRDHRTLSNAAVKYLDAGMTGDSIKRLMGLPSWVVFEDDAALAARAELRAKARADSADPYRLPPARVFDANGIERR